MILSVTLLDQIGVRYGRMLSALGKGTARKIMGRALNYEGKKAMTVVKRVLRKQTSAPSGAINAALREKRAGVMGGALEYGILGRGPYLKIGLFKPRQGARGASAVVWGKGQSFPSAFGAPGGPRREDPTLAGIFGGNPMVRLGASKYPINALYGPNIAKELVRDATPPAFFAVFAGVPDRVAKEIAAVLRGF